MELSLLGKPVINKEQAEKGCHGPLRAQENGKRKDPFLVGRRGRPLREIDGN
jgi:hypothetical protein